MAGEYFRPTKLAQREAQLHLLPFYELCIREANNDPELVSMLGGREGFEKIKMELPMLRAEAFALGEKL